MSLLRNFAYKLSILKEFFAFLWQNKLWWLIPIIAILAIFSLILIFAETSPIAPFIYTLF